MELSDHFTLRELTRSDYALRHGLDNMPSEEVITHLRLLCLNVLEPIRALFSLPLIVTSGYRCPRVNAAIGGAPKSQHRRGDAADFHILGISNLLVIQLIVKEKVEYDQLILEGGEEGWIHVSNSAFLRRQVLSATFTDEGTIYREFDPFASLA